MCNEENTPKWRHFCFSKYLEDTSTAKKGLFFPKAEGIYRVLSICASGNWLLHGKRKQNE